MDGDGIDRVRAALGGAASIGPPAPEPPDDGGGWGAGDQWIGAGLPPDCPIRPLGKQGMLHYYLDQLGQLVELDPKSHSKNVLFSLMGAEAARLREWFPRYAKGTQIVVGWQAEELAERLMTACARRGVWDVPNRLRGPGAWVEDDGTLLLHCGDGLLLRSAAGPDPGGPPRLVAEAPPGLRGRYVYPAGPEAPRPGRWVAAGSLNPAERVLQLLETWNWRRGGLDARLLLGWIGAGIVGGALDWRPMAWVTGEAAAGKSTLHLLLKGLLGDALIEAAEASEAGVRQAAGHRSHPVLLDEQEASADNRKVGSLVRLARIAASGAFVLRGGENHVGQSFTARCCFLFSSILIPPMAPQDLRRMAILELRPLAAGAKAPPLVKAELAEIGGTLRARLVAGWPRWAETLAAYREGLADRGHKGGGQDQFGALLAAADLLLHDGVPDGETVAAMTMGLEASVLADEVDDVPDWEACLRRLRSFQADAWSGGSRRLIGGLVEGQYRGTSNDADQVLALYGLKLVRGRDGPRVFVANSHEGTAQLFAGSRWAEGVWRQSLGRVPGAAAGHLRVGGVDSRGVLLPLRALLGWDPDAPRAPDAGAEEDLDGGLV